jgi:hypothetical protein
MRDTIARKAILYMHQKDIWRVMWGDGNLVDIGAAAGIKGHPLDIMKKMLNAMSRSSLFTPFYIHGHDSRARPRVVRGFELKDHSDGTTLAR